MTMVLTQILMDQATEIEMMASNNHLIISLIRPYQACVSAKINIHDGDEYAARKIMVAYDILQEKIKNF